MKKTIKPTSMNSFYKLAGTLKTPKELKNHTLDELIDAAREAYITNKYKLVRSSISTT